MKLVLILFFSFQVLFSFAQPSQKINHTDENGLKQGVWKKKHENGKLRYEGAFKDDKPVGTFKYYYPQSGKLSTVAEYFDNGRKMNATMFYENGKKKAEGLYIDEKKEGEWRYYNDQEVLISVESYKLGAKTGTWKTFFPDGTVSSEKHYKNDLANGPYKEFFANGKVKWEGTYVNDKLEGEARYFNSEGKLSIKGNYLNDKKHGKWIFYKEGEVEQVEEFIHGVLKEEKKKK